MLLTQKKRWPKETWQMTRKNTAECDQPTCLRYTLEVNRSSAQWDQLISEKLGINKSENVHTLYGRCHLIEEHHRHRMMIIKALKNGVLCPNWRAEPGE